MADLKYSDQQINDLRKALKSEGVELPLQIDPVAASGGNGIIFISANEVLKLYKRNVAAERNPESYFLQSNQALINIQEVADELEARQVMVPRLLGSGKLSATIDIHTTDPQNTDTIYAWQRMTRVHGEHSIKMYLTRYPANLEIETTDTLEMAKLAAKLHVQVDPVGKEIKDGIYLQGKKLDWNDLNSDDPQTQKLVSSLKTDIARNSSPVERPTLLHGDFHPGNVMTSKDGYSVFDWDQQRYGRPEMDVWLLFSLRPQRMEEYVKAYNANATQPLNETLVTAYGLAATQRGYMRYLERKPEAVNLSPESDPAVISEVDGYKLQIHELAKRLHTLTGREIYADTAKEFSYKPPIITTSENDLNLTPVVDRLESMIRRRVSANREVPLVVLIGESHSTVSHIALQQMLMERFVDPQKDPVRIALGVEWPHNIVEDVLGDPKFKRPNLPESVRAHIAAGEGEQRFFRTYQDVIAQHRAPLAHRSLLRWAEQNNVSTRPVDAAWEPDFTLDQTDPLTRKLVTDAKPALAREPVVTSGSPEREARYMEARNLVIRDRVQAHIAETNAQVYFLPYGRGHVVGSKGQEGVSVLAPFDSSLVNLFASPEMDTKLQTLPVYINLPGKGASERLAAESLEALRKGVVIEGLNAKAVNSPTPFKPGNDFSGERSILEEIYRQSGIAKDKMPILTDPGLKASFGYEKNFVPQSDNVPQPNRPAVAVTDPRGPKDIWSARFSGLNNKISGASVAIELTDAAIKGDKTKAAETVGSVVVLKSGMTAIEKLAGVRAVPIAGQVVGLNFAIEDAAKALSAGQKGRAAVSGTETFLYAAASAAAIATAGDCWNPTAALPLAVTLVSGAGAVTLTAARTVYDNWNTVAGWFGHGNQHQVSVTSILSEPPAATGQPSPSIGDDLAGKGRGSLRVATGNASPPSETQPQPKSPTAPSDQTAPLKRAVLAPGNG